MMQGVIFFDYDGTLVDEREAIYIPTQRSRDTIKEVQKKGYLCILATGRAFNYVPLGAKELGLDGYICSNGAYVVVHEECLYDDVFESQELIQLIHRMNEDQLNYFLESCQACYVKDKEEQQFKTFVDTFKLSKECFIELPALDKIDHSIEKITIIPPHERLTKKWMKLLDETYDCCRHRHATTFDIAKKWMHKGIGVQKVIEHFHIPYEQTYAFGDGTNDVGLLKEVCHGIAMEKHACELDAYSELVTASVKDEGIYHALKKLEVLA